MIYLKTPEEIELLRKSNVLVGKTLAEVAKAIRIGVTTLELDKIAEDFIRSNGALPGFLGYQGFPNTLCVSVNDQVVHGIPSNYALKDGDIVSVDCGTIYKGFYGDSAYTFPVGNIDEETAKLLKVTKESLSLGAQKAVAGNRIGDIGNAIQKYVEQFGFSVVREMVGHGIGKNLHESPEVPNYGKPGHGKKLADGMVICIEPMINAGKKDIYLAPDGWSVCTVDRKKSAHFEWMVAVHNGVPEVLTTFDYIETLNKF
jgi:methionyl aminopeptidase